MLIEVFIHYAAILLYFMLHICIYFVAYFCRFLYVNKSSLYKKKSHYCADSQITTLKLYLIATQFVNFKHNFPKEIETFFKNKLKWIKEKSLKMHLFSSELSFHIHNWLIINLKDFCIVIRKWPTFLPSTS